MFSEFTNICIQLLYNRFYLFFLTILNSVSPTQNIKVEHSESENLKFFEHLCDNRSGKFHTFPHLVGYGKNADTLNILYNYFQSVCIREINNKCTVKKAEEEGKT